MSFFRLLTPPFFYRIILDVLLFFNYNFHMSYPAKIDLDMTLEELNSSLGHKLLDYANSLALVLMETFWGYPYFGMKKSSIDSELAYIKKIRDEMMDRLRYYADEYPIFELFEEMKNKEEKDKYIISKFRLDPYFWTLDKRAKWLKQYLNSPSANIQGQPIKKKYKITLIWAFAMRSQFGTSYRTPWANIIRLLKCFYERLKNTSYGSEISISDEVIKDKKKFIKQKKEFKKRCFPIISNRDNWDLIGRIGIFIPGYLSNVLRINPYSIKFNKESIEIAEKFEKYLINHIMKFKEGKKYYIMDVLKLPPRGELPFITFPEGESLLA